MALASALPPQRRQRKICGHTGSCDSMAPPPTTNYNNNPNDEANNPKTAVACYTACLTERVLTTREKNKQANTNRDQTASRTSITTPPQQTGAGKDNLANKTNNEKLSG